MREEHRRGGVFHLGTWEVTGSHWLGDRRTLRLPGCVSRFEAGEAAPLRALVLLVCGHMVTPSVHLQK